MKVIKRLGKKVIIYVVIFMIILASCGSGVASAYTVSEIGSAIAGFSKNFVEENNKGTGPDGRAGFLRYSLKDSNWSKVTGIQWGQVQPASDGMYWYCCATFVSEMYEHVAGFQIRTHGSAVVKSWGASHGESVNLNSLQPGDILYRTRTGGGHVAIYIGNNQIAQASTARLEPPQQVNISDYDPTKWLEAYRISEETASQVTTLNSDFSITGTGNTGSTKIDYSNFFFNGIPDGKYSLARANIFDAIIDFLQNILYYLTGILALISRMIWIGFASMFDRLLNWTVANLTDTNTYTVEDIGLDSTRADDTDSKKRYVTVESILYNELDFFDVNVFKDT